MISSRDIIRKVGVRFLGRLRVELQDTDRRLDMILLQDLGIDLYVPSLGLHRRVWVPAGFRTNLASIPRALWWIPGLAPVGRIERAAALHDWLYSTTCDLPGITRAVADAILEEGMRADGECWLIRELVWINVRLFGASHWRKSA